MDKSNGQGRVRNRYAKLQPLVNRISEIQDINSASNNQPVKQYNESGMFNSHAHQLQNDSGNLGLAKSRINASEETRVIEKPMNAEFQSSKIPTILFNQSIISTPVSNAGTLRKHKKQKHRNKEELNHVSLLDLKTNLLDIMNCVLYIVWSPVVFFTGLILTLVSSLAAALYNISRLFVHGSKNTSQNGNPLHLLNRSPRISNSIAPNSCTEKENSDLKKYFMKRSSNLNPGSRCISPEEKNSDTIGHAQSENQKISKDLQSLTKKFNPCLEMVDEMHARNLEFEHGKYFQYYSRLHDIGSVDLSSGSVLDKYNSSLLLDFKNCSERPARQCRDFVSSSGLKTSASAPRNPAHGNKRLQIDSRNTTRESKLRFLIKNLDSALSDTSKISEKQSQKTYSKNQFSGTDVPTDPKLRSLDQDSSVDGIEHKYNWSKNSSPTFLVNNLRQKRSEMSGTCAIPSLPLNPTLQKQFSSQVEEQCEEMIDKFNHSSSTELTNDLSAPSRQQSSNQQSIVKAHCEITEKLELFTDVEKDLSQKNESDYTATDPIMLNECNAQKLISECDTGFSSLQDCKLDLGALENGTKVSGCSKEISGLDVAARRDEPKKQMEKIDSANLKKGENDLSESQKVRVEFEGKKRTNGSGDRAKLIEEDKWRSTEFTKPIDAKSKWIEMKKKFYGKDYPKAKDTLEKSEAENLPQIKSVSKLPAHKIFQYNMLVGRARQMGSELSSPEEIFLEEKATSPSVKAAEGDASGFNPKRSDSQSFRSVIPTVRCLSHTQSLSQWPNAGNYLRSKKHSLQEQRVKPKPKPRTEVGLNCSGIIPDRKTSTMIFGATPQSAQRQSYRTNSSASSSDFRNVQTSQNRVGSLNWPLQMKSTTTENSNLSDEYAEKIDSLISFCRYPSSPQKDSIHRYSQPSAQKLLDKVVAGDSS